MSDKRYTAELIGGPFDGEERFLDNGGEHMIVLDWRGQQFRYDFSRRIGERRLVYSYALRQPGEPPPRLGVRVPLAGPSKL